jgi:hypothetical protein
MPILFHGDAQSGTFLTQMRFTLSAFRETHAVSMLSDQDRTILLSWVLSSVVAAAEDASFAGQGVCYETMQLAHVKEFAVGGTIQVIINTQATGSLGRTLVLCRHDLEFSQLQFTMRVFWRSNSWNKHSETQLKD